MLTHVVMAVVYMSIHPSFNPWYLRIVQWMLLSACIVWAGNQLPTQQTTRAIDLLLVLVHIAFLVYRIIRDYTDVLELYTDQDDYFENYDAYQPRKYALNATFGAVYNFVPLSIVLLCTWRTGRRVRGLASK